MFGNLKSKNSQSSVFKDMLPMRDNFNRAPGASSSVTKHNESRLVRCRVCGFICDTERDLRLKDGSWAGFGISQGVQKTAGTSIGDAKTPAAGSVSGTPDKYYDRTVRGGCPCCGTYLYDTQPAEIPPLQ